MAWLKLKTTARQCNSTAQIPVCQSQRKPHGRYWPSTKDATVPGWSWLRFLSRFSAVVQRVTRVKSWTALKGLPVRFRG